jgi:glycosyltransferase involved in cell wall biosynthesis
VVHERDDTLLAFGHFGSYKRLEDLIEVMADFPDRTLAIAGTDSRHTPGYLDGLQQRYRRRNVVFLGYIPEHDVPHAFRSASLCVLPYATTSGMSSVAIQAAMYGVPIVASDIPGFRSLSERGLRLNFFTWGDRRSLRDTIAKTLAARQSRERDALHNLEYCRGQKMDSVVDRYLDLVEGVRAGTSGVSTEPAGVDGPSVVGSK